MTIPKYRLVLVSVLSLALSGCASAPVPGGAPTEGSLELAVSETCTEGSDPQCILVGDDYVMRPAAFEHATVADAAESDGQEQNAVDITFTAEGAAVLQDLTAQAAQSAGDARLLISAGGEIVSAAQVMEALEGDQITIALAPQHTAREVLDLMVGD